MFLAECERIENRLQSQSRQAGERLQALHRGAADRMRFMPRGLSQDRSVGVRPDGTCFNASGS